MNKELLIVVVMLLVILIGCSVQQSLDSKKPLSPINLDDPELYRDSSDWFEPYDGR